MKPRHLARRRRQTAAVQRDRRLDRQPCQPRWSSTACSKARACTCTMTSAVARSGACQSWLPKCPTQSHDWLSNTPDIVAVGDTLFPADCLIANL